MSTLTLQPALNFSLLLLQRSSYRQFRRFAISVSRSRRDVAFVFQTFTQLPIRPAHMLSKYVPTGRFILREIAPGAGNSARLGRWVRRLRGILRRGLAG